MKVRQLVREGVAAGIANKEKSTSKVHIRFRQPKGTKEKLPLKMVEEGYGKVLSRGATDERTRELCIVALLGAANHERQLHSHLSGALNVGAAPDSVEEALEVGLARLSNAGDAGRLRALWQRVRSSRCSSISRASG